MGLILKSIGSAAAKLLGIAFLVICFAALGFAVVEPGESARLMLADEPYGGWLGSMFFGAAFAGVLAIVGFTMRLVRWLFTPSLD